MPTLLPRLGTAAVPDSVYLPAGGGVAHPVCRLSIRPNTAPTARNARLKRTNRLVERLSLNRSQCGGCSTRYDTPTKN